MRPERGDARTPTDDPIHSADSTALYAATAAVADRWITAGRAADLEDASRENEYWDAVREELRPRKRR